MFQSCLDEVSAHRLVLDESRFAQHLSQSLVATFLGRRQLGPKLLFRNLPATVTFVGALPFLQRRLTRKLE